MQSQPQLSGKLGAPINRATGSNGHHTIMLDAPHFNHTTAHLDGEVQGWSKVKKRLGKETLDEGDTIIVSRYQITTDGLVAREIC